ncbi:M10 family metallopeptidase C-terminal domain-containing protein [uncultured Sphingomonas sp.]|uniref:M10 family metallopeptidase C-terminal domain-containing protein n=1 Tax=uncultured Sphingomonas sp. TaxID=158754 RepID=UPI0025E4E720|nr:M10 family metallopeptidase C-terminal domain-containing protein [uncultured Sphingomonas sp.]
MARVTLTAAEIAAALTRATLRLGNGQFTFSVPTAASLWPGYAAGTEPYETYSIVTPAQAAAFKAAIATWDELIAPDFTEVVDDGSGRGEIRVAFTSYDMDANTGGYAYQGVVTTPGGKSGDVWINATARAESFDVGSYNFELLIHELGHSLGLEHSFDTPAIPAPYENTRYTVMSYTFGAGTDIVTFRNSGGSLRASISGAVAVTPMVVDISAVQSIYGADTKTRAGDTVYTFDQADNGLRSIYDAGGSDTIDLSNFTRANIVDLAPGAYSSIGLYTREAQIADWTALFPQYASFIRSTLTTADLYTHTDNLGIALSSVIENATGGSAADQITGNAVANVLKGLGGDDILRGLEGNDRLEGGAGKDILVGGSGSDTFVFLESAGDSDRIEDFSVTDDWFDLGNRIFTRATSEGGTTLYYAGGQITLNGVFGLSLDAANARVVGYTGVRFSALPLDGATDVSPLANIRLVFSAPVTRGSGAITLTGPSGFSESYGAGDARVTIVGNVLTIDPAATLQAGQSYSLAIASGALTVGGVGFGGLTDYDFTTRAIDKTERYQLAVPDNGAATVSGSASVYGTRAGMQDVTVLDMPGQVIFDPSFNAGGDRIRLSGAASGYTVTRSGSTVFLNDGDTSIGIPVGLKAVDIVFADGVRSLGFDATDNSVRLGGQPVTGSATLLTAGAATATVIGAADPSVSSILIAASRATVTAAGNLTVFGHRQVPDPYAGASANFTSYETVRILPGSKVVLDGSFNAGGDTVLMPGDAATYTAARSGSSLILTSATEQVTIPVGLGKLTVKFDDAERVLTYDSAAGVVKFGAQTIGTTAAGVEAPGAQTTLALGATQSALDGDYRFTHAGDATGTGTVTGFARGDTLVLQGTADRYVFGGSGGDVTIGFIGTDGLMRTTTLTGIADPAMPIHDRATAEAAVGFSIFGV